MSDMANKNDPNEFDEDRFDIFSDQHTDIEEDNDEKRLRSRFPAWVTVAVTILVLITFVSISLPDFSLFIGKRFDFLSQNASLEKDPLVLAAREAVVSITAIKDGTTPGNNRAGTGFVISADGHILTNLHVVENAQKIKVELTNGDVYYVTSYMSLLDLDIAIISIQATDLPYLKMSMKSLPELNNTVTVVGNPLGFSRIAARGTINRYFNLTGSGLVMELKLSTRPGSSGSPVINDKGQAIGIVFATLTEEDNKELKNTTLAIPLHLLDDELGNI